MTKGRVISCADCSRTRVIKARGLCGSCYDRRSRTRNLAERPTLSKATAGLVGDLLATGTSIDFIAAEVGIEPASVRRLVARHHINPFVQPPAVRLPVDAPLASCATDPVAWDLDQATRSQLVASVAACTACPHLGTCATDPAPPLGTVHAGRLISDTGKPTTLDSWARGHREQAAS